MVRKRKHLKHKSAPQRHFVYYRYTHPFVREFEFWIADWHRRIVLSFILGFVLSVFSKMYPICTQQFCYQRFFELVFNPVLLTKPFVMSFVMPQFIVPLAIFAWSWFAILSIFGWIHHRKWLPETFMPVLSILLFVYLLMQTSGALTPFVITVGNLDCATNNDCIRAGYVGEVCTSVYKSVYTTYSIGMKPLTNCICLNNHCVGN
jgi:hypothetical protein